MLNRVVEETHGSLGAGCFATPAHATRDHGFVAPRGRGLCFERCLVGRALEPEPAP